MCLQGSWSRCHRSPKPASGEFPRRPWLRRSSSRPLMGTGSMGSSRAKLSGHLLCQVGQRPSCGALEVSWLARDGVVFPELKFLVLRLPSSHQERQPSLAP